MHKDIDTLFGSRGVHTLVDGQFGSTGKGVLASYIAREAHRYGIRFDGVLSNAGPNSGHTFYHGTAKVVLKQLPTFAVQMAMLAPASFTRQQHLPIYLTAGAIIDPEILRKEAFEYPGMICVHPNAAVITEADRNAEADLTGTIAAVAGTRSGTGMALARKVMRDPDATFAAFYAANPDYFRDTGVVVSAFGYHPNGRYFNEVSQGFSLGLNQRFYPKCTSRECTVSQSFSDAGIPPTAHARSYLSLRTYPIRVGNVDGHSSGEWYSDQVETSWEDLGVEPELTTVTQRVRRVATFSPTQLCEAVQANDPDVLFLNFLNYLSEERQQEFVKGVAQMMWSTFPKAVRILGGYSHRTEDVKWVA